MMLLENAVHATLYNMDCSFLSSVRFIRFSLESARFYFSDIPEGGLPAQFFVITVPSSTNSRESRSPARKTTPVGRQTESRTIFPNCRAISAYMYPSALLSGWIKRLESIPLPLRISVPVVFFLFQKRNLRPAIPCPRFCPMPEILYLSKPGYKSAAPCAEKESSVMAASS